MNSHVITIGREFGSGGHEIGMKLAERLGVPFYDRELITLAAEQGGIDPKLIERNEEGAHRLSEKGRSRMPFFSLSYTPDFSDAIYLQQCKVIKDLAAKGPCVIVGRCADFVLRSEGSINVFIAASMPYKIKRKRKVAIEKKDYTDEQKLVSDKIDELNAEIKRQETIVDENKGIFGDKARRRKEAKKRIEELKAEIAKLEASI